MTDADRHYNFGPLQPMAPDAWHDRPHRLAEWATALGTAVLCAGLVIAVVLAAIVLGA